jgi:hypothetical protein
MHHHLDVFHSEVTIIINAAYRVREAIVVSKLYHGTGRFYFGELKINSTVKLRNRGLRTIGRQT